MKKILLSAAVASAAIIALASGPANDPVLMNVGGQDVRLSEFEYLYKKNNAQQMQPQTIDKYVDMFVDYKLKVADARAAGIDTTQAFLTEFLQFRNDLAKPYLRDTTVTEQLMQEMYDHNGREVLVSHIMLPMEYTKPKATSPKADIDSLRELIVSGKGNFEELAKANSIDRGSSAVGGKMGWIAAGRFPWDFEKAAYDTPIGEISPVVNSGYGWHIIRVEDSRPARGEVEAQHILLLTRGKSPEEAAKQKERIDSIYQAVTAPGADFSDFATRFSEDRGSARSGGNLGWFGTGVMVAEFDSVAFSLPDGAISEPFTTPYGWHIVKRLGHRGPGTFEELRPKFEKAIESDYRASLPEKAKLAEIEKATGSSINTASVADAAAKIKAGASLADVAALPAYTIAGTITTIGEVTSASPEMQTITDAAELADAVESAIASAYTPALTEYARLQLEETNPDYRNLVNEYRDGIMLFEISNRNVWDRAAKDKEGLEKYFRANRKKYTWDSPRFKSIVVFATSDSVLTLAKEYADSFTGKIDPEKFTADMRERFGKNIRVERVIAAKGENPITDYLGFGGEKPEAKNPRWVDYFAFRPQVIDAPQEAADVRGLVVTDYQNELETKWLQKLHKKYKVIVNRDVLKLVE